MTKEEAIKGLKENLCSLCAYGSQNMDSCDIRKCDNRDYIKVLEQQPSEDVINRKADNLCNSCTNIGCEFQSGIFRTECTFYMPPNIEPDNCGNYVIMPPVTPTHGTCNLCKHLKVGVHFTFCELDVPRAGDGFYCADFEKRGELDGSN